VEGQRPPLAALFFAKRRRKENPIQKKRRGFVSPSADGDKATRLEGGTFLKKGSSKIFS